MFIRITRLILIILASVFLGVCIVLMILRAMNEESSLMLKIGLFGSIVLIAAIVGLQFFENKKAANEQKQIDDREKQAKLAKEKQELAQQRQEIEAEKAALNQTQNAAEHDKTDE